MSLRVWLPMTKDLSNQGLENISITNNGATLDTNGKLGKCYSFNGSNNYILETGYSNFGTNYSVSLWFYCNAVSGNQCFLSTRSAIGNGFSVIGIGNKLRIDASINKDSASQWTTEYIIPTNSWHHLVVIRNDSEVSYYIDGEFKNSKTVAYYGNYGNVLSIGASQSNGTSLDNYLNGKLNDVRIYDHALSAKEVELLARGLVAHYPLDGNGTNEYDSTIVYDTSGMQTNGTLWAYDTLGEITTDSDTPRYSACTYINSDNNTTNTASGTRYIYGNCTLTTPECLTVAFWCKPIAGYARSTAHGILSLTNNAIGANAGSDYQSAPLNHRDAKFDINSSTSIHKSLSVTFTANEWHHYAIVYDGRYGKLYKDAVEVSSIDMGSNVTLGSMRGIVIGFSKAGGVWRKIKSYYSDFRLYVTPLSATQIVELYNTAAHIDNHGNMFAYEYIEN